MTTGHVTIVGGGPGDPGLITVAGLAAIHAADVIVTDRLGPVAILDGLPDSVEVIKAGKGPGMHVMSQDQINACLVEHGLAGRRVVRLKGGDPFVFGRGMEEVAACRQAGVPVDVVPGVSSAIAVPGLAGITLTHRGASQGFVVVTGHVPPGDPGSEVDWEALARSGCTIVVLMGVGHLGPITSALMAAGLAERTPVACICDGTLPSERVVRGSLGTIAHVALAEKVTHPAVVVIGATAGDLGPAASPRLNKRVLVLGGARSGKSAFAESRLNVHGTAQYVATSPTRPDDPEWVARIDAHRARRPSSWATTDVGGSPHDLAGVLVGEVSGIDLPVVVDAMTGWLAATLDAVGAWDDRPGWRDRLLAAMDEVVGAWRLTERHVIAVSDEVGSSIVPDSSSGRLFRDELGRLNQRLAANSDEVWLVTAGVPRRLA